MTTTRVNRETALQSARPGMSDTNQNKRSIVEAEKIGVEIVGQSPALLAVLREVRIVAKTNSTVLIMGETGTGKELIAQALHNLSPRRANALCKINCAAIPAGLLESELFGHERGAFTGAVARKAGRFEIAHGGTLFLDEIADIPLELQPKLLRVLQEKEFERLGSTQSRQSNVRMVAATSRDLTQMVADRQFRSDLYYRLSVFPIRIPALRERLEDIPLLVRHFVDNYAGEMNKRVDTIPHGVLEDLTRYQWPGNVRELQNVIERAVIRSSGNILRSPLGDLEHATIRNTTVVMDIVSKATRLDDLEREHILGTLGQTRWVVGGPKGAAKRLGVKRTTLLYKMKKLGIAHRAEAIP
ncbi:MAG TPA: sigma 54-interacting transcriptional regulator [Verrucomicrobiae bacterium]|nr:sigma 54-interacting transcriptional regulator [Verrucomicrobiae bacterium]